MKKIHEGAAGVEGQQAPTHRKKEREEEGKRKRERSQLATVSGSIYQRES
jgi:hypothetical protein